MSLGFSSAISISWVSFYRTSYRGFEGSKVSEYAAVNVKLEALRGQIVVLENLLKHASQTHAKFAQDPCADEKELDECLGLMVPATAFQYFAAHDFGERAPNEEWWKSTIDLFRLTNNLVTILMARDPTIDQDLWRRRAIKASLKLREVFIG